MNLVKKPYLKSEALTYEDLQLYHPTLRIHDWRPVIRADSTTLQWMLHTPTMCNGKNMRKVLKINSDLSWECFVQNKKVSCHHLSIPYNLANSKDLDDFLFICAKIPLCLGFQVDHHMEDTEDETGKIMGKTWMYTSLDDEDMEAYFHQSVNCILLRPLTGNHPICSPCANLSRRYARGTAGDKMVNDEEAKAGERNIVQ